MAYLLTRTRTHDFCARIQLPRRKALLGRSRRATLRIPDPSVSKLHASIEGVPGTNRYRLSDLGSKNGIVHRGKQCSEVEVGPGDEIRLGNVLITVCGDGPETIELPESIPRPTPAEGVAEDSRGVLPGIPWRLLLAPTERRLLLAFLILAGTLATIPWLLPERQRAPQGGVDPAAGGVETGQGLAALPVPASGAEGGARGGPARDAGGSDEIGTAGALPEPPPADPPLSPPPGLRPGASGGDPLPSAAALADLSPAEASRIRRILGLLLCRSPSAGEILRSAGRPAGDLLAEAAGSPEFWRERARSWLKGRGRFPAHGGFPLPASLIPLEVPLDRSDWVKMLRAEGERAAPEATRPAREGAPLPEDDGDDRAYRGWLLRSVEEPPRTPTPAADLRGIWAVLWGRPPGHVEEELLLATLDRGIGWDQLRRPMISLLLNAPSMPFPGPAPGGVERWVAGSVNLLLGREIGVAQTGEIARQIAGGNIDPRLLLEECLLSAGASPAPSGSRSGPGRRSAAGQGSKASPVSGGGMVRIEARCSFPVRALLGTPERIPRLWKRLERSLAEIFPPHAADPEELFRAALLGAADGTLLILPRLDLLPEEALGEGRDLLLADGFLLAPIRRLVDRIGEPIPSRPSEEARRWLRERLAVAPPEIPRAPRSSVAAPDGGQAQPAGVPSPAEALFRAGGYRLVEGEWLAATYRPATRTLLLARAQLEMEPGRRVVVGIDLSESPAAGDSGEWQELMTALDFLGGALPGHRFELWLWGGAADTAGDTATDTAGTEAVHLAWGPSVKRGRVMRMSEDVLRHHPALRGSHLAPGIEEPVEPIRDQRHAEGPEPAGVAGDAEEEEQ